MKKLALVLVLLLVPVSVLAQEEVPKAELGISYELLRAAHVNSVLGAVNFDNANGINFRGTYNVNRWAAVETTFGLQPNLSVETIAGLPDNLVLGAPGEVTLFHNEYKFKATARQGDTDQVGLFAYAGPGWLRADPNAAAEQATNSFTKFTFEFGGGVEYYPHRSFGMRIDLGDLVAKLNSIAGVGQNTTHNLVVRAGVSFRFR